MKKKLEIIPKLLWIGFVIWIVIMLLIWFFGAATELRERNIQNYKDAVVLYDNGEYMQAYQMFYDLLDFRDSLFDGPPPKQYIEQCAEILQGYVEYCPRCGYPHMPTVKEME